MTAFVYEALVSLKELIKSEVGYGGLQRSISHLRALRISTVGRAIKPIPAYFYLSTQLHETIAAPSFVMNGICSTANASYPPLRPP